MAGDPANVRPPHDIDAESTAASGRRDPLLGTLVANKFRVLHAIARGGMGRIYYAMQEPLDRPVALKVVQGDGNFEKDSQFLKRFQEEASILAKLQHPNVVMIFDYGRIEEGPLEQYFIAMEYLAGETLTQRLVDREFLDLRDVLFIGRQMSRGLREAHARGIVHRDLKPPNVLLVPEADGGEIVKIVDFGIGKVLNPDGEKPDLTQDGFMVGTPRFMAPEQFEGTASPASDLYALGTILYLCATGKLPYTGSNPADLMVAKLARPFEPLRVAKPDLDVPHSFETLVTRLLARNPDERPTHDELANLLANAEDDVFGSSQSARRTGSGLARSNPQMDRSSSRGAIPADRPSNASGVQERLRVGHTMVAPQVVAPTPRPGPFGSSVAPPPSFSTPRSQSSKGPIIGAIALVLLLAGGAAVWFFALRPKPLTIEKVTVASATPSGTPASDAPPAGTFTLTIESTPAQARVFEANAFIGTTPMQVSIDRVKAATEPRVFVIKKEGFADGTVVQGTSTNDSTRSVTLAPDAADPVKSRPVKPAGTPATTPKPPPTPSSLDIRIKR